MLAMLSIHPSRNEDLVTPHRIVAAPDVPMYDYLDAFGNVCTRVTVPAGGLTLSCDFTIEDERRARRRSRPTRSSFRSRSCPTTCSSSCSAAAIARPIGCPIPPGRVFGHIAPGWARVQAIVDFTHDHVEFGYHLCASDQDGVGRASGAAGRVPRFRPSRDHPVPLHEHPGALLHRLSRRHRRPAGRRADGFLGLVRSLSRRRLVHLRCPPQPPAHRPDPDGARARRRPIPRSPPPSALPSLAGFDVHTDEVAAIG